MRIINKLNWFERNVLGLSPKDKIRVAYEEGAKAEKKLIQKDLWNIYCMENDIDRLKAIYDLGLKRELKQKHLGDKNNGTF